MLSKRIKSARKELRKDLLFMALGAVVFWILANVGAINFILGYIHDLRIAAFIAGLFFTTSFTIVPASFALAGIASVAPTGEIALFGALGAMIGDVLIFVFIRDRFAADLMNSLKPSVLRHILASFHLGFMKWISPIIGALLIASPLPDEFGLALLGLSRTKIYILLPIAFVMNWLGIYLVVWLAHVI